MAATPEPQSSSRDVVRLERSPSLVMVLNTPKGRGVFATHPISSGTTIEICPVLIFPLPDLAALKMTLVDHYSYNWPLRDIQDRSQAQTTATKRAPTKPTTTRTTQALSLGLGSIFNHSGTDQNVGFRRDVERELIIYTTLRDVRAGEELCLGYGQSLWFEDADGERGAEPGVVEREEDVLGSIQI